MNSSQSTLLISPFFFPEPVSTGKYNTHLCQGLVDRGIQVDVLCSHPVYPAWKPVFTDKKLNGVKNGVKIIRGGRFIRYPGSPLLRRFILEAWFFFFVLRHLLFNRKHYDSVIFIFPPNLAGLLAFLIPKKNTRIIGIIHDIQGVMAHSKASLARKRLMKIILLLERRSYLACDKLIFLSEKMRKVAQQLYGNIPVASEVCYPFITLKPPNNKHHQLDDVFRGCKYSLVYSGALGEKQAPHKLLKLLVSVIETNAEIHGFIFSQGSVFDQLKASYSHPRLHFHPFVEEIQLAELISRSTVQIIPQETGTSDGAFPSKLANILAVHGNVFCITDEDSELDTLLRKYSRALVCHTWEDSRLADKLNAFIHKEPASLSVEDEKLISYFSLTKLLNAL